MVTKKKTKSLGVRGFASRMVANASLFRSELMTKMFDPRRDIDIEAGYPKHITPQMYRRMYDYEGVAKRVVHFWPEESWVMDPLIFETEEPSLTPFEEALAVLLKKRNLYHYMERVDKMSGIGRYGVLLLGIDDGKEFDQPIDSVPDDGEIEDIKSVGEANLLYIRVFSEEAVRIDTREPDKQNPRYGQPLTYSITLTEHGADGTTTTEQTLRVHWSRIIHVADGKEMSETLGTERMKAVWKRLLDLQKVMGGNGEMFWKGAYPGYALETDPNGPDVEIDTDSVREQIGNYQNGLQRWLAVAGVKVKSLTPQVTDPTPHKQVIMDEIAFAMAVPKRKFFGSEQAQLASGQDNRTFNARVSRRNEKHVTPSILKPMIERLIAIGVLPSPTQELTYEWPDLNTATDDEKAQVAKTRTEAIVAYVAAGAEILIPPAEYLSIVHGMDHDEVEQILAAAEEFTKEMEEDEALAAVKARELAQATGVVPVDPNAPPVPPKALPAPKDQA